MKISCYLILTAAIICLAVAEDKLLYVLDITSSAFTAPRSQVLYEESSFKAN